MTERPQLLPFQTKRLRVESERFAERARARDRAPDSVTRVSKRSKSDGLEHSDKVAQLARFLRNVALGIKRRSQMVTKTQKTLVQQSFAAVAPIARDAALFYQRLFELDPSLNRCSGAT